MTALEEIRDFVNTADFEAGKEELADAAAREVREAIRVLIRAHTGVAGDIAAASDVLDRASRRAGLRVGFVDGQPAFRSHERSRVALVLASVAEAMADGTWPRLKACRSDSCQWAFVDGARNRSRQWCDMSVCGNREKARRFRSRRA
jgi:predicted RNA-binding Zn ribbon-like protein